MTVEERRKAIFTLWDEMGKVSYKTSKYLGFKYSTLSVYYMDLVAYYNLESIPELFELIAKTIEDNFDYDKLCGGTMHVVEVHPPTNSSSPSTMELMYNGIGGVHSLELKAEEPKDFVCPDTYDYLDDEKGENCFYYECVHPATNGIHKVVNQMFGIRIGSISIDY